MATISSIAKRKSTRKFNGQTISSEAIQEILLAGCQAPVSSAQYDGMQLTVIKNQVLLKKMSNDIAEMMRTEFQMDVPSFDYYGADTIFLVSTKKAQVSDTELVNVGTVTENMILQATELGISSCIMWLVGKAVAQNQDYRIQLGIREGYRPVLGIAFGYSDSELTERKLYMKIKTNIVD